MTDIWHPFTQLKDFVPLGEVVGARGAWLHLADGRRLFDGIASWWVNPHGHAHPRIAEAIAAQARAFDQVILADFTHRPAQELTRRLTEMLPGDLDHVYFSDDGSTAVEVGLKLAWQAHQRAGETGRTRLVAMEGGYHGDTLGAMRVGDRDVFTAPFAELLGTCDFLPYGDAEAAEAYFAEHGHEVALCITEPLVQGAGGMRMASADWLRRLADAVRGAGAFLVVDEVATGFGRTGTMFACEAAGVVPDVICLSKGISGGTLALGATACRTHLFERFLGADKRQAFLHGHSYCGNPLTCAAALASLDVFEDEGTVARFAAMDDVWARHAPTFEALDAVGDVRWRGGVFAFDLEGGPGGYLDPVGKRLQALALEEGLYVRPLGHVVYMMPSACATDDELDWALDVLARVVPAAVA